MKGKNLFGEVESDQTDSTDSAFENKEVMQNLRKQAKEGKKLIQKKGQGADVWS